MKKEEIRKEFFKLRARHHSYNQCKKILLAQFGSEVTKRTLYRWSERLNNGDWDLRDNSTRPKTIKKKITSEIESEVIKFRKELGWGERKIQNYVELGHTSINKILRKNELTNPSPRRKKKTKIYQMAKKTPKFSMADGCFRSENKR